MSPFVVKKSIASAGNYTVKLSSRTQFCMVAQSNLFLLLSLLAGLVKNFCKFNFLLEAVSSGLFGLHEPR